MISSEIKKKIENLFEKKKYEDLIKLSNECIRPDERPPGLASLIGTCYFLKKKRTLKDLSFALEFFEEAYFKGQKSIHGLSGVTNFMNLSVLGAKKSNDFLPYLKKAEKYYNEVENYFEKNPDFLIAAKNLFWFQLDNKKVKKISDKIISSPNSSFVHKSGSIFFHNYIYNWSQQKYTEQAVSNSKNFSKYKVVKINEIKFDDDNKINIGFICGDFTDQHSLFYFLKDTIKYLDRTKFKVFLFSFNRGVNAQLGQKEIKSVSDEFIELDKFNNQDCINLIQKKKIYILIDVMGFSFTKRVEIFNSRVAPTQISWLATCNTLGFETIDYLIADENLIPEAEENQYPEKILKLPNIWNSHCGYDFERVLKTSPCLRKDFFTFGSLNNFHKISDEVVLAWSKILKRCENSKLILKSSSFEANSEKIIEKFKKYNVEKQIILLSNRNYPYKKDHLNVYNDIDLALDTFPYNGVTTTFESLWMSVPVLVLKGFNFNSRCGYSIIRNSKIDKLISNNQDEYIERAVYYYNNRDELSELKKNLFNKILSTPLFQTKNFSADFAKSLLNLNKNNLKEL